MSSEAPSAVSEAGYCSRCPSCGGSLTCKTRKCSSPERKIVQKFPNCCETCGSIPLKPTQVERHLGMEHALTFDADFEALPLNLLRLPSPPEKGMQLVALVLGQGKDSYLSMTMFYSSPEVDPGSGEKYVTWLYNHESGGASEGHYHHRFTHGDQLEEVAWKDFADRSRQFSHHAARWNDWERQIRTRVGAEKVVTA